ncbi:Os04g0659850, partial [Oryza sativa Japonica Group]
LVAAEEVEHDAGIGEVYEPVGLVEAEAGEEVARRGVAEGGVAEAADAEVEEGGGEDRDHVALLHRLALRRWRSQRVL